MPKWLRAVGKWLLRTVVEELNEELTKKKEIPK